MVDFAKAFSLGILRQDLLLNIPTYQRKFVWGETQIRTLLNDIKLHIDDPSLNAQYMFIGHALLYQPVVVISGDQTYSWFEDAPSAPTPADETRVQGLLNSIGQGPLWVAGNFGASFADLRSRLTNDSRTQIQVIDGQQRTTVLALLARVLEMLTTPASPSKALAADVLVRLAVGACRARTRHTRRITHERTYDLRTTAPERPTTPTTPQIQPYPPLPRTPESERP